MGRSRDERRTPYFPASRDPEWVEAGAPPPRDVQETRPRPVHADRPLWLVMLVGALVLGALAFLWPQAASRPPSEPAPPPASATPVESATPPAQQAPASATPEAPPPAPPVQSVVEPPSPRVDRPPAPARAPAAKPRRAKSEAAPARRAPAAAERSRELLRRRAFERARQLGEATQED